MADNAEPPASPLPPHVERWAALRTAARWEKQIAGFLVDAGVPYFLPLMTKITLYQGKRRSADVPVFPGYVFCSEAEFLGNPRVSAVCRKRVAQVLRPSDPAQMRRELEEVAEMLTDRQLIQERVVGRPGDRVRVVGGPFKGSEGVIRRLDPKKRLIVIEISFLGARVEIDVDESLLSKPL